MAVILYHNPRCSKSRLALALLEKNGIHPTVIEYLKTPPSKAQLRKILEYLAMGPRDLMRKKEAAYKTARLDDPALTRDALIDAMIANPILIERPIAVHGDRAVIGRPPENILHLFRS